MLEKIIAISVASVAIVGLVYVMGLLHSQYRVRRHLNRLRQVPLDQWSSRRSR